MPRLANHHNSSESLVYDDSMTYLVGFLAEDGIVLGADGLSRSKNLKTSREWISSQTRIKFREVAPYTMVGLSGNTIHHISEVRREIRSSLKYHKPRTVHDIARRVCAYLNTFYMEFFEEGNTMEVIIAGYDLDAKRNPAVAKILYARLPDPRFYQRAVAVAGNKPTTDEDLEERFSATHNDYESLKTLASDLIDESTAKYPEHVGGNKWFYHITSSGIDSEAIRIADIATKKES